VLGGRLEVRILIVEEDVRPKCLEYLGLFHSVQEEPFVDVDVPVSQGLDDSHLVWSVASGQDGDVNRRELETPKGRQDGRRVSCRRSCA
jgi:hypothetical protein